MYKLFFVFMTLSGVSLLRAWGVECNTGSRMAFGSSCGLPRSTAVKVSEVVRLNLSQMRYQTPGPFTRALTLADSGHRLCILGTSVEAMTEAGPRLQSPPHQVQCKFMVVVSVEMRSNRTVALPVSASMGCYVRSENTTPLYPTSSKLNALAPIR